VCKIKTGKTPSKANPEYFSGNIPFYKPGDLSNNVGPLDGADEYLSESGAQLAGLLPESTVLVSCIGYLGKVGILGNPGSCNQQMNAILPSALVNPRFVLYWAKELRPWLEENASATTIYIINKGRFEKAPFALPPLEEQRRIVSRLDNLFGKSDRARQQLARIAQLVERCKQGVLVAAFSGRLSKSVATTLDIQTVDTPSSFRQTLSAPRDWKLYTLGDVCRIEGGSQPPKSEFKYEPQPDHVRFIQIRDYKSDKNVTYIPRRLARRFCQANDIMIGRYGPPIFQILEGLEGAYNVALMKAVPDTGLIVRDFLFYFLQHPTLRTFVEIDAERTAGQDGVNKAHLLRFPIFLPSLEKQHTIVESLKDKLKQLERTISETTRAEMLLDHFDQTILSKAFLGKHAREDITSIDIDTEGRAVGQQ
jgi:type I restriction enzyme S subunit